MPIRSPNHPSVSLPVALERARQFHLAWGPDEAGFEESLRHWGYTPRSNMGRNLVKSMTTFGLIETSGRGQQQRLGCFTDAELQLDKPNLG